MRGWEVANEVFGFTSRRKSIVKGFLGTSCRKNSKKTGWMEESFPIQRWEDDTIGPSKHTDLVPFPVLDPKSSSEAHRGDD